MSKDSTTELWRCAEAFGMRRLDASGGVAAKLDRMGPEDTIEQKVLLPLIRSIIERRRGNAVKAVDLLDKPSHTSSQSTFVSTRAGLSACRTTR